MLLSWAVPKGPSINPADKRLAMHVEDHPIEYGTFEGVIPEGYGAGIVQLWDQGTWTSESDDVDAALKKGDLKFTLNGFKLKGSWVLVRTRGYGESSGRPGRSWLLIKHRDDWAGPIDITTFAPYSVKTPNADLADILAADNPDIWRSHAPAKGGDTGALFRRIIAKALELKAGSAARFAGTTRSADTTRSAGTKGTLARRSSQEMQASEGGKATKGTKGARPPTIAKTPKTAKATRKRA